MKENEQVTKKAIAVDGGFNSKIVRAIVSQHDMENIGHMSYNVTDGAVYKNMDEKTTLVVTMSSIDHKDAIELINKKAPNARILFIYRFRIDAPDEYGDIVEFIYSGRILDREVYW